MTEKQKKVNFQKDYFINEKADGFLDKIAKSKWVKALFGVGTVASASQLAACANPPPAEVAPLNEAAVPEATARATATLPSADIVTPTATLPVVDIVTPTVTELINFDKLNDALLFLMSEGGAKWLSISYSTEIQRFPEGSPAVWDLFRNLKSVGNVPHVVLLIPKGDREISVVGVEIVESNTYLDYINKDGDATSICVSGLPDYKDLLGSHFTEWSVVKSPMVWPSINYPNGDCEEWKRNPVPGVTDGFACSSDGENRFYYQYQSD